MMNRLQKGDALLIVDAQIDFFPGGALGVFRGHEIIPVINEWIAAAKEKNVPIFASRDWHPENHCSFKAQGGIWPSHCIQNTHGAKFHPGINLPPYTVIIDKANNPNQEAYSAFQGIVSESGLSLEHILNENDIKRIWINGLALDYCVVASALEARQKGFEVHVLLKGTQAITKETGSQAIARMQDAGIILEEFLSPYFK